MAKGGSIITPLGLTPAQMQAQIDKAVADRLAEMPNVDLQPVMSMIEQVKEEALAKAAEAEGLAQQAHQIILTDRASSAVVVAETASSIDTLEEAIAALNALSASYAAALPASLADRQALHQQDEAFIVMVADLTTRLEALKTTDSTQTSSLATQQAQIQTMMGQIQSFLTRPLATPVFTGGKTEAMPLIALGNLYAFDIPVTGAKVGMPCQIVYPTGFLDGLSYLGAQVEVDGFVKVRLKAGVALLAGSRTFKAYVWGVTA